MARNVDSYLADLKASSKGQVQLALIALGIWPLLTLKPPLPLLSPASRKTFLQKRFIDEISERRTFRPIRPYVEAMIRTGAQMSYLGYYGDRRSWPAIGYTPFADRHGGRRGAADRPAGAAAALARGRAAAAAKYDAIVVGSGAAGAILAYRFAQAGRRVLVVERGPHVDPRQFTDDEVEQYLKLYNEGALQLATNFSLQVLQGMCVGGGTTINNALCLHPPTHVLDAWDAVDRPALEAAIDEVRTWLGVAEIRADTTSQAARRFAAARAPTCISRASWRSWRRTSPTPASARATATSAARSAPRSRGSTCCCPRPSSGTSSTCWPTWRSSGSRATATARSASSPTATRSTPTRS